MSRSENIFRFFVRIIFLFAYGAFLWASIHHIAYFYHNFEGTADWTGPYALAISIDVTSLVLAAGLMFFSRNMSKPTLCAVAFFVLFLTAFSWTVNWEYAAHFQAQDLTANPLLRLLNPILASSFAFLNLAYSIVSGVFTAKPKTAEELAKEAARLESLEEAQKRIAAYQERTRKPSLIARAKETAKEAKAAINEVRNDGVKVPFPETQKASKTDVNEEEDSLSSSPFDALSSALDPILEEVLQEHPLIASWLATGRKTVTKKEICEATGRSMKTVVNRIEKHTIKPSARNPELFLVSSVLDWVKDEPNGKDTGKIPAIRLVANGHQNGQSI